MNPLSQFAAALSGVRGGLALLASLETLANEAELYTEATLLARDGFAKQLREAERERRRLRQTLRKCTAAADDALRAKDDQIHTLTAELEQAKTLHRRRGPSSSRDAEHDGDLTLGPNDRVPKWLLDELEDVLDPTDRFDSAVQNMRGLAQALRRACQAAGSRTSSDLSDSDDAMGE